MIDPMTGMNVTSGFFLVRPAHKLYEKFRSELEEDLEWDVYGWPRKGRPFGDVAKLYQGTDRDPLSGWYDGDQLAELRLDELEKQERACDSGLVFQLRDLETVCEYLPVDNQYEMIWVREEGADDLSPAGFKSLGFEPTWFPAQFSGLCDCMFLPRWHGADPDNLDLIGHYDKLNANGLFVTPADAKEFIIHYLTYEWAEQEHGTPYVVVEVFAATGP
jgi:hypothetical protein